MMLQGAPRPVVCALVERDGCVLLARRPPGGPLGHKWEFPGGKVETGETAEAALHREIHEELDCAVTIRHALPRSRHDYDEVQVELIPFVCGLAAGSSQPRAVEHVALAWVRSGQLADYDLAAADLPVLQAYLAERSG